MFAHEKRRYFRTHFKRQVQLDFFTDVYDECKVKDISFGGMFVNGEFPSKVGDQCFVNMVLKNKKKSSEFKGKAKAKIVRQDDEGIALEFISMSFESMVLLELILLYESSEKKSHDEIKLPAELPFEISEEDSPIPDEDSFF